MTTPLKADHWTDHAKQWHRIGAPLRPCGQDISIIRKLLGGKPDDALLLGVTASYSELADNVIAVDKNPDMIKACWTGQKNPAVLGNWLNLSNLVMEGSFNTVLGDGSLNLLTYPHDIKRFFAELDKVTVSGTSFVIRLFVAPEQSETVDDVFKIARSGEIGSFHAFKWRLAHAMCAEANDPNIEVRTIHECFLRNVSDRFLFAQQTGFPVEIVNTIDAYIDSTVLLVFPTLKQMLGCVPDNWELVTVEYGDYELSERCPIVMWRRK